MRSRSWIVLLLLLGCGCGARTPGHGGRECGTCDVGTVAFVNVDDCHCCKPPGAACTDGTECCGGCVDGHCGCLPGLDHDLGVGQTCGNPAACCSGACDSSNPGVCR